jgi:hypothetical protein
MAMKMPSTKRLVSTQLLASLHQNLAARTVGSGSSWPSMVPVFKPKIELRQKPAVWRWRPNASPRNNHSLVPGTRQLDALEARLAF